jgi:hypothetical protein
MFDGGADVPNAGFACTHIDCYVLREEGYVLLHQSAAARPGLGFLRHESIVRRAKRLAQEHDLGVFQIF